MSNYEITGEPKDGGYIEKVELDLIEGLPQSPVVFDVGANVGDFTQAVLERRPEATVFAFEPQEEAQNALRDRFSDRRVVVMGALGPSNERRILFSDGPTSQLGTFYPREGLPLNMKSQGYVEVLTLARVCSTVGVGWIDLLKLDCEGFEYSILLGAGDALDRITTISWELIGREGHPYTDTTIEDFIDLFSDRFAVRMLRPKDQFGTTLYEARKV